MFDNGSFLRRRKRYKRTTIDHSLPFPASVFGPFNPFWIRKPVPIFPIQFNIENSVGSFLSNNLQENFDLMAAAAADSTILKEKQATTFVRESSVAGDATAKHTFFNSSTNIDFLRHNINVLRSNPNNITEIDFHAFDSVNAKHDLFLSFNQKSKFRTSSENLSRLTSEMFGNELVTHNEHAHTYDQKYRTFEKTNVEVDNIDPMSDTEGNDSISMNSKSKKEIASSDSLMKMQTQNGIVLSEKFEDINRSNVQHYYSNEKSEGVPKTNLDTTDNQDYEYELQKKVTNIRNATYFSIENLIGRSINTDGS